MQLLDGENLEGDEPTDTLYRHESWFVMLRKDEMYSINGTYQKVAEVWHDRPTDTAIPKHILVEFHLGKRDFVHLRKDSSWSNSAQTVLNRKPIS